MKKIFLRVENFKLSCCIFISFSFLYLFLFNNELFDTKSFKLINTHKFSLLNKTKWIVITSINEPTQQIEQLSNQKEFTLLVVADLKTNQNWSYKNTIYLSVNHQLDLKFKSIKHTPFNSYTRKNIGYLYAIQNGAKFIYDTDDDNEPITQINDYFDFNEYRTELEYDLDSPLILNPYAHFGQPTIWPRGYPLNKINYPNYNNYICSKKLTSIIQQSVVNGDPDVDAIFRLTKSLNNKQIDLYFDNSSPSVRIPKYKLTPFNSQNTLYHYKAFWALYLPHTVSFRLTDIWRSYWSQRLLWLLDSTISFYGPNAYQLRNVHSYLSDYKQEKEMYLKTKELIDYLYKWKCKLNKFYSCVIDLSLKMAIENFWDWSEVNSIKMWLNDLNIIGYIEPKIINNNYEYSTLNINDFIFEFQSNESNYFKVKYTPEFQLPIDIDNYYVNGQNKKQLIEKQEIIDYFLNYCDQYYSLKYEINKLNQFSQKYNIVLLITFNHEPILDNILFLYHMHKSVFKNIVFCGKNILNLTKKSKNYKKFSNLTLIEFNTMKGYFHYSCMSKVIDMNYRSDGIFLISDDVLFKNWEFNITFKDKIIFHKNPICLNEIYNNHNWPLDVRIWMNRVNGNQALKNLSIGFENIFNNNFYFYFKRDYEIIRNYFRILNKKSNNKNYDKLTKVCKELSDVFYIPSRLFYEFNLISNLFNTFSVFLEFAVPTILSGLIENEKSLAIVKMKYFGSRNQFNLKKNYNDSFLVAHSFKLSKFNSPNQRLDICKIFVQDFFNRL